MSIAIRAVSSPGEVRVWDIQYQGHNIWGATAGMLLNLYRLCVSDDPATAEELANAFAPACAALALLAVYEILMIWLFSTTLDATFRGTRSARCSLVSVRTPKMVD